MALYALSNYAEKKQLNHLLGVEAFTMPSAVYLALFTSNPGPTGSGNEVSEDGIPASGYARKLITFNAAVATDSEPPHSPGGDGNGPALCTNLGAVEFGEVTGENWGEITHVALFDAEENGNMLAYGAVAVPQVANIGGKITLPSGDLEIRQD
jgi:hypothetical protein